MPRVKWQNDESYFRWTRIFASVISRCKQESIQATERDIRACSELYSLDYASIHGKLNSSGVVRLNGADKCMRACASMQDVVLNLNCPRLALLDIHVWEKRFNFEDTLHIYIYELFWIKVYGENLDQHMRFISRIIKIISIALEQIENNVYSRTN